MNVTDRVEFEKFLNLITSEYFYYEGVRANLKAIGINPDDWPACEAKTIMQEFNFYVDGRGIAFAKIALSERVSKLPFDETLPKDLDIVLARYSDGIKKTKVANLCEKMAKTPLDAEKHILEFQKNMSSRIELKNLSHGIRPALEDLQKRIESNQAKVILPDFPLLSESIGGFNPKRISIITAISGFGKTKLAINLALSARKIMNVIYYNMEMGDEDFVSMFIQRKTETDNKSWYEGKINPEKIESFMNELESGHSISYSNGQSLTIDDIISSIYQKSQGQDMLMVIIDYDQKIISNLRTEEWMAMVRTIEKLEDAAKKANAQIILLAQADEDGKIRSSKRGNQPASAVLNFYSDGDMALKKFLIKPLKNRFGRNDFQIELDYHPAISKITEKGFYDERSVVKRF